MKDMYTTPASQQGLSAQAVVKQRVEKLVSMAKEGRKIQDTVMARAFAEAV